MNPSLINGIGGIATKYENGEFIVEIDKNESPKNVITFFEQCVAKFNLKPSPGNMIAAFVMMGQMESVMTMQGWSFIDEGNDMYHFIVDKKTLLAEELTKNKNFGKLYLALYKKRKALMSKPVTHERILKKEINPKPFTTEIAKPLENKQTLQEDTRLQTSHRRQYKENFSVQIAIFILFIVTLCFIYMSRNKSKTAPPVLRLLKYPVKM